MSACRLPRSARAQKEFKKSGGRIMKGEKKKPCSRSTQLQADPRRRRRPAPRGGRPTSRRPGRRLCPPEGRAHRDPRGHTKTTGASSTLTRYQVVLAGPYLYASMRSCPFFLGRERRRVCLWGEAPLLMAYANGEVFHDFSSCSFLHCLEEKKKAVNFGFPDFCVLLGPDQPLASVWTSHRGSSASQTCFGLII